MDAKPALALQHIFEDQSPSPKPYLPSLRLSLGFGLCLLLCLCLVDEGEVVESVGANRGKGIGSKGGVGENGGEAS